MTELENRIFAASKDTFESLALEVFAFQYQHCTVYRNFVDLLGKTKPKNVSEIPFLPIEFFKSQEIISQHKKAELTFMSSGTTGQIRSKHLVADSTLYIRSFELTYRAQIGNPEEQLILALLPNYLEQGQSSLVFMVDKLIQLSKNEFSGFYKDNFTALLEAYQKGIAAGKKVILFGVSYALLDLAELKPKLSEALIIETGGMKGRRKEISKEELHQILKDAFQVQYIASEYGMTELLSQGYSDQSAYFSLPPWMKILIRDTNDPFSYLPDNKTGGINVIDLANLYSCSFISTQDLGQLNESKLKLMGRFDNADIRGCNLLIEN